MATSEGYTMKLETIKAALFIECLNWSGITELLIRFPWAKAVPQEALKEVAVFVFEASKQEKMERLESATAQLQIALKEHDDTTPQFVTGGKLHDLLFVAEQLRRIHAVPGK